MMLDGHSPQSHQCAAQALADGRLLGLPTETVYGLAADADNPQAVADVYRAKGRPADHPLIVHIARAEDAAHYARDIPDFAHRLMAAFWPGPLTLILARRPHAAAAAAGGQDSIGLRCPAHPVAQAVLHACAQLPRPVRGIAAPSANRFGRVSPTTAAHVQAEFATDAFTAHFPPLLVLDGGPCTVGIESTIVDCTRGHPIILRPGVLTSEDIARACAQPSCGPSADGPRVLPVDAVPVSASAQAEVPRASGTLSAHYAPRARLCLMDAAALQCAINALYASAQAHVPGADVVLDADPVVRAAVHDAMRLPGAVTVYHRSALHLPPSPMVCGPVRLCPMPADASRAAAALFADLRRFDDAGSAHVWVETPPPTLAWEGVRDRLQRAAAAFAPPLAGQAAGAAES